jgi:hypothetical protein
VIRHPKVAAVASAAGAPLMRKGASRHGRDGLPARGATQRVASSTRLGAAGFAFPAHFLKTKGTTSLWILRRPKLATSALSRPPVGLSRPLAIGGLHGGEFLVLLEDLASDRGAERETQGELPSKKFAPRNAGHDSA